MASANVSRQVFDLSVPSLVSLERTSPSIVQHQGEIAFNWTVRDVPITHIWFTHTDSLGSSKTVG